MSDQPQGPGWYQASDGRWYPPAPTGQVYAPPGPPVLPVPKGRSPVPWLIAGALVLFCLVPGGCVAAVAVLGSSSTTTINVATGENKHDAAGNPGTGKDNPAPIGRTVSAAKGWTVTVNSAELNANQRMKEINEYLGPTTGKQFVLVNVTISNNSDRPDTIGSQLEFALSTKGGRDIDELGSCIAEVPDEISSLDQIQQKGSVTGNICFEASAADVEGATLLAEPLLTLDKVEDQQFLAIR
jgi:hypothetical protein